MDCFRTVGWSTIAGRLGNYSFYALIAGSRCQISDRLSRCNTGEQIENISRGKDR